MFSQSIKLISALALTAAIAYGGTATFTPTTPTTVEPGMAVSFQVELAVESLAAFETADVIIGANQANEVTFDYSLQWFLAFASGSVSPITPDFGNYTQDIFVGGNNPVPVGSQMILGIVTIDTSNMAEGSYVVQINHAFDNISGMTLGNMQEVLNGSATYTIQCVAADGNCDGSVNADDFSNMAACLQGPSQPLLTGCGAYDTDADGDVDVEDYAVLTNQYNGL